MTVINLATFLTGLGSADAPTSGTVTVMPWRGFRPAVLTAGENVVFPKPVTIRIVDGVLEEPLDLAPTTTFCYRVLVRADGSASTVERFVAVPEVGPVDWEELEDVDQHTFVPTPDVVAGWDAALAGVTAQLAALPGDLADPGTPEGAAVAAVAEAKAAAAAAGKADILPASALDASTLADGPVVALTRGDLSGSYGNTPASVSDGTVMHTPTGPANTAAYIEGAMDSQPARIGARAEFPAESGTVALVIPSASWTQGIGTAGVHITLTGSGQLTQARFNGVGLDNAHMAQIEIDASRQVTLEASLDARTNEIRVYADGLLVLTVVDPTAFTMLSEFVIWELYEQTGVSETPARFLSTWADIEQRIPAAPTAQVAYEPSASVLQVPDGSYPIGTSPAAISGLSLTVVVPKSGRVALTASLWLDATDSCYMMVNDAQAQRMTVGAHAGRVTYHAVLTGNPGAELSIQIQAWVPGGSGAFTVGGQFGASVVTATPI